MIRYYEPAYSIFTDYYDELIEFIRHSKPYNMAYLFCRNWDNWIEWNKN